MSRFARRTIIAALIESSYGTDSTPDGSNAILVSNPTINPLNAQNVDRDLVRGFMGSSEQLVGSRFVELGFDVELVGSGAAGTAPAWGDLLEACGFDETVTASTRVDYTPISSAFPSVTIAWHDDGLKHTVTGCRGNVVFRMNSGGRPVMSFTFRGLYAAPAAASNPTPTYTGFKTPRVVSEANTADLTLGCTHSTSGAPALASGTAYPSLGVEFSPNNTVEHIPLLGGESVEITDRAATCSVQLELTAAEEATFMGTVADATLTSIGMVHGTDAGYKSLVFLPYVQLINPQKQAVGGKRMTSFEGRVTPSAGDDEMRLVLF